MCVKLEGLAMAPPPTVVWMGDMAQWVGPQVQVTPRPIPPGSPHVHPKLPPEASPSLTHALLPHTLPPGHGRKKSGKGAPPGVLMLDGAVGVQRAMAVLRSVCSVGMGGGSTLSCQPVCGEGRCRTVVPGAWWPYHRGSQGSDVPCRVTGSGSLCELMPTLRYLLLTALTAPKDPGQQARSGKQESRTRGPARTWPGVPRPRWSPQACSGACGGSVSAGVLRRLRQPGPRSSRAVIWARTRRAARPRCGRAAPCPPSGCSRRSAPASRG